VFFSRSARDQYKVLATIHGKLILVTPDRSDGASAVLYDDLMSYLETELKALGVKIAQSEAAQTPRQRRAKGTY